MTQAELNLTTYIKHYNYYIIIIIIYVYIFKSIKEQFFHSIYSGLLCLVAYAKYIFFFINWHGETCLPCFIALSD